MRILLVSCYELGHQPFNLASPAAYLLQAGFHVDCLDLAVEPLDEEFVRLADLVAFSTPMHTALRLARKASLRVRQLHLASHICFYGLYASLHAELLLEQREGTSCADTVIGGEFEGALVRLARSLSGVHPQSSVTTPPIPALSKSFERQEFLLPHRSSLPALEHYAHLVMGDRMLMAGYVEASRGCAHRCLHCPITPVYDGRVRIVQKEVILQDIEQLLGLGAQHITFGDPDFLNGVRHSLAIVREMHHRYPNLTFDFTAKVEHIIEYESLFAEFRDLGCVFVVSAVELLNDTILEYLDKGHTRADVEAAIEITHAAGITMRPSLMPFTPWTTLQDLQDILALVEKHQLYDHVDPVQYSIRLLIPPNSSLLKHPELQPHLGNFDSDLWIYRWHSADATLDELQARISKLVEQTNHDHEDDFATYLKIRQLVLDSSQTPKFRQVPRPQYRRKQPAPRLTEDWFC